MFCCRKFRKTIDDKTSIGIALMFPCTVQDKDLCCLNISIGGGRSISKVWLHGPLRLLNHQTNSPFRTEVSGAIKKLYYKISIKRVGCFPLDQQVTWDYFSNASDSYVSESFQNWEALMCKNVREVRMPS